MKVFSTLSLGLAALVGLASSSYVGYTYNGGTSPNYVVKVVVQVLIPAAYTVLYDVPGNVDSIARLVLGNCYDLTSDVWMFPPQAVSFAYASVAEPTYTTVGANLAFEGTILSDIEEICSAIANGLGIPNVGWGLPDGKKRHVDGDDVWDSADNSTVIEKRDGNCYSAYGLAEFVVPYGLPEQPFDTFGSCGNL